MRSFPTKEAYFSEDAKPGNSTDSRSNKRMKTASSVWKDFQSWRLWTKRSRMPDKTSFTSSWSSDPFRLSWYMSDCQLFDSISSKFGLQKSHQKNSLLTFRHMWFATEWRVCLVGGKYVAISMSDKSQPNGMGNTKPCGYWFARISLTWPQFIGHKRCHL